MLQWIVTLAGGLAGDVDELAAAGSQDKDAISQQQVLAALRRDGPYRSDAVACDMRRALDEG